MSQYTQPDVQRVLDSAARKGVELHLRTLSSAASCPEEAAILVGADLGQIVDPIVFVAARPEGRLAPVVCLVSGRNHVDPCLLAAVIGESAVRRATASEVRELTGYQLGMVPPFGHGRNVRTVMDADLGAYEWVWALAGSETTMLRITPGVLCMLANAFVTPLAETSWAPAVNAPVTERQLQFEASSQP